MDLSEIINPKKNLARRMAEAGVEVEYSASTPKKAEKAEDTMTQSQFTKVRTPEERDQQQRALAAKLRAMNR